MDPIQYIDDDSDAPAPAVPIRNEATEAIRINRGITGCFPHKTIRPFQVTAMRVIATSIAQGKRYTIIEGPTGTGKSPLGIALARWAESEGGGYLLTSQKILTNQMMEDYHNLGLLELKGRSNYQCQLRKTLNCEEAATIAKDGKLCEGCRYKAAKDAFCAGTLGTTNYSYSLVEARFAGLLPPRPIKVMDEAHQIEKEVLNQATIEITPKKAEELKVVLPEFAENTQQSEIVAWVNDVLDPAAKRKSKALVREVEEVKLETDHEERRLEELPDDCEPIQREAIEYRLDQLERRLARLVKDLTQTLNLIARIETYIKDGGHNCFAWSEKQSLMIRPLSAADIAQRYLFKDARHVLLMSATILDPDTMMRALGIDPAQATFYRASSDFPVTNRPLIFMPVGSMSAKSIEMTTPRLHARVEALLNEHADVKGLIHTANYEIRRKLVEYLAGTVHRHRILTHEKAEQRDQVIEAHKRRDEPTVLISPSMTEGLDLKDDLSRFQIICKVPYPRLDPYTTQRKNLDNQWYQLQTAITLVQACGRSIRSKDDWAKTYILDSAFEQFLSWYPNILPLWWREAIELRKWNR